MAAPAIFVLRSSSPVKASDNAARVAALQSRDVTEQRAYVLARLSGVKTSAYIASDDNGIPIASDAMAVLRDMLAARVIGTLDAQLADDTSLPDATRGQLAALRPVSAIVAPRANYTTPNGAPTAGNMFATYAEQAHKLATVQQLGYWLQTSYIPTLDGMGATSAAITARRLLLGLSHFLGFCMTYAISDKAPELASSAILTEAYRREALAASRVAWRRLVATHAYVGTGKLTNTERKAKRGHAERRARERAQGKPAHH